MIVTILIYAMGRLSLNNNKVVPSRFALIQESLFGSILGMINSTIGKKDKLTYLFYIQFFYMFYSLT